MSNAATQPNGGGWREPYQPSAWWRFYSRFANWFSLVWSIGAAGIGLVLVVLGVVLQFTDAPSGSGNPPHVAWIAGIAAIAAGVGVRIWTRRFLSCGIEVGPVGIRITRVAGEPMIVRWNEIATFEAEVAPVRQPALLVHLDSGESIRTYHPPLHLASPWRALARPWELFQWPWKVSETLMAPAEAAAAHLEDHLRRARENGPGPRTMG